MNPNPKAREKQPQRGDIKRFREHLNKMSANQPKHSNGPYHQLKRQYGDYLYAQDRDKFMWELVEWLNGRL